MGFTHGNIQYEKKLYHANVDQLIDVIRGFQEMPGDFPLFLFGHNPGLTDLVNELLDENIDNLPTTGVISCHLAIEKWAEADVSSGKLDFFDYPKKTY
jgi:phosphohistidine phosphatase